MKKTILQKHNIALKNAYHWRRIVVTSTDLSIPCLEPNHPRAKGNIKWYEDHLAQEGVKKADMRRWAFFCLKVVSLKSISSFRALGEVVNQRPASVLGNSERAVYEALCRNEVPVVRSRPLDFSSPAYTLPVQSEKDISKLYCYYKRDRPYLVYAPIKVSYGLEMARWA